VLTGVPTNERNIPPGFPSQIGPSSHTKKASLLSPHPNQPVCILTISVEFGLSVINGILFISL